MMVCLLFDLKYLVIVFLCKVVLLILKLRASRKSRERRDTLWKKTISNSCSKLSYFDEKYC